MLGYLVVIIALKKLFKKSHLPYVGFILPSNMPSILYRLPQILTSPFSVNGQKFILKYIHEANYDALQEINNKLRGKADYVRLFEDIIPEKFMFVFQYFTDHLLRLAQKNLSLTAKKRILKDVLQGIAELHDQNIVHAGSIYFPAE
jgi:serine/threonine protein kinase